MVSFFSSSSGLLKPNIRYKLVIVEALIFVLPLLCISYIIYHGNYYLDISHLMLFSLIFLLILGGLIILRQIFERISTIATSIKKVEKGDTVTITTKEDVSELHDISLSLNNLAQKLKETTGELSQRTFELLIIKQLTENAKKKLNINDLMDLILGKCMAVTGTQIGSVFMVEVDPRNKSLVFPESSENGSILAEGSAFGRFRVVATNGHDKELERGSYISIDSSLAKPVVLERKTLLIQDIEKDPRTLKANDPKYGPPSFLSIPIFIGDRLAAVMNLAHKETGQLFDSNDEQVLSIMLGEINFALENALLHSEIDIELQKSKTHNIKLVQESEERKRAEEALKEAVVKYRSLAASVASMYLLDRDCTYLFMNEGCRMRFGLPLEKIIGRTYGEFHSEENTKEFADCVREVCETGKPINREHRSERDGRYFLRTFSPIMDQSPAGEISKVVVVSEDITELKQAQASLQKSNLSLAEAQRVAHIGNWEWNIQTNETYWSDEIHRIFGTTPQTFVGTYEAFLEMIHPDDRDIVKDAINMDLNERAKAVCNHRIVRSDGSVREVHEIFEMISDDTGKAIRMIGIVQDVTERNQTERELQRARDLLIQSEKLASIGRLSAGVAHEILNPVNIISMELQILQTMESLPPEVLEELKICMDQISRIVAIAENLKQFSRMPERKTIMADINGVIAHVLTLYATQLKIEGIETEVQYQPDLPKIDMDKEKIEQVILNLITNAMSAMEGKEKKVLRITTERETMFRDRDQLKIMIADTGTGIKSEHMSKIFDPFFTTKGQGKGTGTGLGLSISYGIVHDHGGRIWAENNEWGGASFYVRLPIKTDIEKKSLLK